MRIYNTLTRQVEEIHPLDGNKIRMYTCGPTVYRYIHIGNLRSFTMADWLRRVLTYRGFEVTHIKNITDVGHMRIERLDRGEDKLIAQARKEGKTSAEIAQFYTQAFHEDEQALNILPAHMFPRATGHIPEMIAIIKGLLAKGLAYEVSGYVYYDTKRFAGYGKLSGNLLEGMLAGIHEGDDRDRRHPEDFPLWKPAEPGREMAWESPWGRGFPGWHIECSAMSMKYLGAHFDIHTGGVDNIFPHHEDEIAQSEGFTGQQYVNYWVHAQHLLADGQKMAKSTGNAYTRAEIEARGFDPLALRYFYTTALYRSRLNFTFRALQSAQTALERLRDQAYALFLQVGDVAAISSEPLEDTYWREAFLREVENDLNMPRAMSVVWAMLRSGDGPALRLRTLFEMDEILGFDLKGYVQSERPMQKRDPHTYITNVPEQVAVLVRRREELRQAQRYKQADQVREEIAQAGYRVRDTPLGTLVLSRRMDEEFTVLSTSRDVPDNTFLPDRYTFSVNLLAYNNRDDLARCIESVQHSVYGQALELLIIDNGSTDETLGYLEELARRYGQSGLPAEQGQMIGLQVLFADHNLGFAAGRNATMRASRGKYIVLLDTSMEVTGDIWTQLATALEDEQAGIVGPYGLVTDDLKEFYEASGPEVDAVEGYLMAFRRRLLPELGWLDEKFRFYRLADIHLSFFCKTAGYAVRVIPDLMANLIKHPHREWFSLSEEERATKSKKNYDLFRARWHHGQSLLVKDFEVEKRWWGHNHARHVQGMHSHPADELPPPRVPHTHTHQHWADHAHEHAHYHDTP